jgi:hypothetical protein
MNWLSIMPVTHALKPTFQNKLSHFFGHSSRLEKLDATNQPSCDLKDLQPISRTTTEPVRKPLQPISERQPHWRCFATTQRSINRLRDGLQPISDASTAIA